MLDLFVGAAVLVLLAAGIAVMIGPANIRRAATAARSARPRPQSAPVRPPAPPALAPNRVATAAARLAGLLSAEGHPELAARIQEAGRLMARNEPAGLRRLRDLAIAAASARIRDRAMAERRRQLVVALSSAIRDRAEQLELLPFP